MAWGEIKVEEQRKTFCEIVLSKTMSHSQACKEFKISRPTGYEWLQRYKEQGDLGLINRSSARLTQNHQTPDYIVQQVLALKYEWPRLGPKKIYAKLRNKNPDIIWPCKTTIAKIFYQNGLVQNRKIRKRLAVKPNSLIDSNEANDVWCMDFKGWHLTPDNYKFGPFTLSDHKTRFLLRCAHLNDNTTDNVWAVLDIAFREYGLPWFLLSDNGPPFATCAPGRLSRLAIKLIKAGVTPEWIEPGKPYQNGRHERMHLTMEQEAFDYNCQNLDEQISKLKEFQYYYNFERPHEAIGQKTPGSIYKLSSRNWNGRFQSIEYPSEYYVGKVASCGKMSFRGIGVYIGRVFSGELIGIKEDQDGFKAYFGQIFLGNITDKQELQVDRRKTRRGR